ncbi:hypothetical protein AAVH_32218 [Aphelenchoides avenae]|nr:hypothetical protein AAVH_32218 [Aphelenchus avenae]
MSSQKDLYRNRYLNHNCRQLERTDELESHEAPEQTASTLDEAPYEQLPEVGRPPQRHEIEAEYQHEEELVPESPYQTSQRGERAEEEFPRTAETPLHEAEVLEKPFEEALHEIESEAVERYAGDIIDTAHREVIREEVEEAQYETDVAAEPTIAQTEEASGAKPEDEEARHEEQLRLPEPAAEVPDAMTRSVYEPENGVVSIEDDEESAKAELLAEGEAKDEFDAEVKSYEADMAVSEAPEELCLIGEAGEVAQAKRARDEGQQAELPEEPKPEDTTRYGIYIPDSQSVEELPKAREADEEPLVTEPAVHPAEPDLPFSEEAREEAKFGESRHDEAATEGAEIKTTYEEDFGRGAAKESFTPEGPIETPEKETTGPTLPQMVLGGAAMLAAGLASKVADQFTREDERESEESESERRHAVDDAVKTTYEEEYGRRETIDEEHAVGEAHAEKPETPSTPTEGEMEPRHVIEEPLKTTYEEEFGREKVPAEVAAEEPTQFTALAETTAETAPILGVTAQSRSEQEDIDLQDKSKISPTVEVAAQEPYTQVSSEAEAESEEAAKQRYEHETHGEMPEEAEERHIDRMHKEGITEVVPEEPHMIEDKSQPTPEPFELEAEPSIGERQPSEEAIYRPESAEETQAAGVERERTEESLGGFDLLEEPKPEPVLTLSPEESPRHEPTEVRDERMVDLMIASTYGELVESAEPEQLSEAPLTSPKVPTPAEEEPETHALTKEEELFEQEWRPHEEGQREPLEAEETAMPKEEQSPVEQGKEREMALPVQAAEETELVESDEVSPEEGILPKLSVTAVTDSPVEEQEEEALQGEVPVRAVEEHAKLPSETGKEQMLEIRETEEAEVPQRVSPDDASYEMVERRDVEGSPTEMSEATDATAIQRKSPTSEDEFYMVVASEEDLRKNLPAESAADVTAESLVRSVIDSLEGDLTAEKIEEPEDESLTKESRGEELPDETTHAEGTLKQTPESETAEDYRGFEKISAEDQGPGESIVTEKELPSAPEGFEKVSELSVSFREESPIETPEPKKPFMDTPEPAESAKDTPEPDEYRDSPLLLRQRSEALLGLSGMEHTDSPKPHGDLLPTAEAPEYEEESGFQVRQAFEGSIK